MTDTIPPPDVPPAEGASYAEICEFLGFDPTAIKSVTITQTAVIAVSSNYPEPQRPALEEEDTSA